MNFQLIDSHCHPSDPQFDCDLVDQLELCKEKNIRYIIGCSETYEDALKLIELHHKYPMIKICIGLHPCEASEEQLSRMIQLIDQYHNEIVGIGEIGLDFSPYYIRNDPDNVKQLQIRVLKEQCKLAKKYDLPINVHSRAAGSETLQVLREMEMKRVLMHSFDGKPKEAEEAAANGYFFSFSALIQISKSKQKLCKRIPLSNILLETDSPALSVDETKRNQFINVHQGLEMISTLKNMPIEEVARVTFDNTIQLFRIRDK